MSLNSMAEVRWKPGENCSDGRTAGLRSPVAALMVIQPLVGARRISMRIGLSPSGRRRIRHTWSVQTWAPITTLRAVPLLESISKDQPSSAAAASWARVGVQTAASRAEKRAGRPLHRTSASPLRGRRQNSRSMAVPVKRSES